MAFTEQEKQIIIYGKQNGKSRTDVEEALYRSRNGLPYKTETVPQNEPGFGAKIKEAALAGVDKIKTGIETATNPEKPTDVITGPVKAAAGGIDTLLSPLAPLFSPIGKLIGYVSDKISDVPAVQKFSETPAGKTTADTADFLADAGTIAGAFAGVKTAPAIAQSVSKAASEAVSALEGVSKVGAEGIKEAVSMKKTPELLMQRVARVSKGKQVAFEERAGVSIGKYLVDRGIFGTPDDIVNQLYERFQSSKTTADTEIAKLEGNFKPTSVGSAVKQLLDREQRVSSPGAISRDLERVRELDKKFHGAGLDMSEINEVKRLFERNVRLEYVKENVPDKVALATNLDSALRKWQFETASKLGLKNLPEINKETMLARQLMDDLGAEYAGSAGNNAISLTDWIVIAGGDQSSAAMFLTKKAATSKTIMSKVAEVLSPKRKVEPVKAELGKPTIDSYLEFLRRTGGVEE